MPHSIIIDRAWFGCKSFEMAIIFFDLNQNAPKIHSNFCKNPGCIPKIMDTKVQIIFVYMIYVSQ